MTVRMRHTRSQTRERRSHHALTSPTLSKDASGASHMRHRMNPTTGLYRGRKVIEVAKKAIKKAEKSKEKANAR